MSQRIADIELRSIYMSSTNLLFSLKRILLISVVSLGLLACDQATIDKINANLPEATGNTVGVSGSVGDGPVTSAALTVEDSNAQLIGAGISDDHANYNIDIPQDAAYPVIITSNGGTDTVTNETPNFTMKTIISSPTETTANINPFSTLIYYTAIALDPNLSATNIDIATEYVTKNFNFGLDESLIQNPITTPVSPLNVAAMIKASEALSETIKRTNDELIKSGITLGTDKLIKALAADIVDGILDGNGASDANSVVAATFTVVSTSVLIESLENRLMVNGIDATAAMDAAIHITVPTASDSVTIGSVQTTQPVIDQTTLAIEAMASIAPSESLDSLKTTIQGINAGSLASDIDPLITTEMITSVVIGVNALETASSVQLDAINAVVYSDFSSSIFDDTSPITGTDDGSDITGTDGTGGDTSGGDTSGGDTSGGDTSGGDTSGGDTSGGDTSGGDTSGGDTSGGDTSGGDTSGGDTSGGDTSGGDTSGGDTSGGDTSGGDTSGGDTSGGDNTTTNVPLQISATTPTDYTWTTLSNGTKAFVDRTYTYSSIPAQLEGIAVLQTKNDDKTVINDNFINFDINTSANVYVAYDTGIATLPTWLSSWSNTGLTIVASDATRALYSKNFSAGTVTLGGNEGTSNRSNYTILVEDPNGSTITPVTGVATPIAADDSVSTDTTTSINIKVLDNDTGLDDGPIKISIIDEPGVGTITIESDNSITFVPDGISNGNFTIVYQIKDIDGDVSTANINLSLTCITCANNIDLVLTWDANPAEENVTGYKIYYRKSNSSSVNFSFAKDVSVSSSGFNPSAPSVTFNAGTDLGLLKTDTVCFSVAAYNLGGTSDALNEVCSPL